MTPEQKKLHKDLQYVAQGAATAVLRYERLNPEQKLAYALERLVMHEKATLALMETVNLLAQECVVWRQTPEGKEWSEDKAVERQIAAQSRGTARTTPTTHQDTREDGSK